MPKRARKKSTVECFEKSPLKSEDGLEECSTDGSPTRRQRRRKKAVSKSKKRKLSAASSVQELRSPDATEPSVVATTLESSLSSENNEPSIEHSQSTQSNKDLESLLSLSSNCKERLMHVVSTAVQFQRHSRHPKLCSSHFSKALALEEDFNNESDDSDDLQDLRDMLSKSKNIIKKTEPKPMTCHGRWLSQK